MLFVRNRAKSALNFTGDHGVSSAIEDFKLVLRTFNRHKGKITLYDSNVNDCVAIMFPKAQDIRFNNNFSTIISFFKNK